MRLIELMMLRLVLWVGIPALLLVLAVGPRRVRGALSRLRKWLFERPLDPQEVLTRVVRQHQEHVDALIQALAQAVKTENEITANIRQSERNVAAHECEARERLQRGDELGARAALFKLNLERQAIENFLHHRERQQRHIADSRRRLYQVELQLRQYELGRSILLTQLAEARTVEQQLAIASHFDPFSAVANWQKAEGVVQEKSLNARAVEQVYADTPDFSTAVSATVDPAALDRQLEELRQQIEPSANRVPVAPLHPKWGEGLG